MAQSTSTAEEQDLLEQRQEAAEARMRREAALRQVRKIGDPVLRAAALPVVSFDRQLRDQARRMGELMHDAQGIGLAATQVGVLQRMFVYSIDSEEPLQTLVNPVIEPIGAELERAEEGCLSIPLVHVEVERHLRIRVCAQDEHGEERNFEAEGLHARVIQHELDHLDGVLIVDRADRDQRRAAMRALREGRPYSPSDAAEAGER